MRRIAATLAVVGLLFSAGSAWADWDDATAAYQRGDYATAFREIRSLAEQGDVFAQSNLAHLYLKGLGVPKNEAEAMKWYRKAAGQGYAGAQYDLGLMYANGEGVPVNDIKAYMWWTLASAQGKKGAAGNLDILKNKWPPPRSPKPKPSPPSGWKSTTTNAAPSAPPFQTTS